MIVLLDTNVVSYLFKGDTRAAAYAPLLSGRRLAVSFTTVAELFEWVLIRRWGRPRVARLEQTLAGYLLIPVDVDVCRRWGEIRFQRRAAGRPISTQDAWIAATALRHQLPLVTHNPVDFQAIVGLDVQSASPT